MSNDLLSQNIGSAQTNAQPAPVTFVAAATVAPSTYLSYIAGITALATITPPVTGQHTLAVVATSTNWAGCVTSGNILVASVTNSELWKDKVNFFTFNPITAKYHPSYAVHSTAV